MRHVSDKILKHKHEHKWRNCRFFHVLFWNSAETGKMMSSVNIHGTGATNTLTAASSERESGVDLVLNFNESVQEHGSALLSVNVIRHILWTVFRVVWV